MEQLYEFGRRLLSGVIIKCSSNNEFFLEVISGLIGVIVGSVISTIVTYKSIKLEKKYSIEIEAITEKILNPLFEKYYIIKLRKKNNFDNLVSSTIFEEVDEVFNKNTCWYFVTNKKIKPVLINIRDSSLNREQENLLEGLEKLYNLIECVYVKKYRN
ncbi:hypothetical protein [Clostridium sp. UBA5712]|uniref:hypothetical protein n=1 Tax=Clostridium sp. UBA5712 TaxID=1946368 RepID=UPI0032179C24